MKSLRAGISIFLLLLSVDGLLIISSRNEKTRGSGPDKIFSLPDLAIREIGIRMPDNSSYNALRTATGWISPSDKTADDLAANLGEMSLELVLEKPPVQLDEFGLDEKSIVSLDIVFIDGQKVRIAFGKKLPLDVLYVYAVIEDTPGIFKVLASYRDRCIRAAGR